MEMAGYSGTPLAKKLGIKPDHCVALIDAPSDFDQTLLDLPDGVQVVSRLMKRMPFDVIVFFTKSEKALASQFQKMGQRLTPAGGLWIAWPKRSSGVATDLSENRIREIGLATGLVDNKVCAIDETWSGLRFVIRLKDRPKK
jgi:hypothetical protein